MKKGVNKYLIVLVLLILLVIGSIFFYNSKSNNKKYHNKLNDTEEKINKNKTKNKKKKNNKTKKEEKDKKQEEVNDNSNNSLDNQQVNNEYSYTNPYVRLQSYRITIGKSVIERGESTNISVSYNPENATDTDTYYASSNKNVAVVSHDGLVTGVNSGSCYINVYVKNASTGRIGVTVIKTNGVVSTDSYTNSNYNRNNTSNSYQVQKEVTTQNVVPNNTQPQPNNSVQNEKVDNSNKTTNTNSQTAPTNNQQSSTNNIQQPAQQQPAPISDNEVVSEEEEELVDEDATSENIPVMTEEELNDPSPTVKTTKKVKNGWYKVKGKKYYFKNGKKLTNTYVNYIYLNKKGVAQKKMGVFSITIYGSRAWANQSLKIRKKYNSNSTIGTIPAGGKMIILGSRRPNRYIKIKYNNKVGFVNSDCIYLNLPDVIPEMKYNITNANSSIFKSKGYNISGVTGKNLYGFNKNYYEKIGRSEYYAPLLFPVARELQVAYDKARSEGYNLKVYDTYRPYHVTKDVNNKFRNLYNSNAKVKKAVNYDKNGQYWGPSWFLAQNASRHNSATALDIALTDNKGNELSAQTKMHTLDTRSVTKYNNKVANKLKNIMTSAGFETLKSEWWHFQENSYSSSNVTSFNIR